MVTEVGVGVMVNLKIIDAVFMMGSLNAIVTRFGVTVVEESTLGAIVSTITFAEVRSSWVKVASEPEIGSTVIENSMLPFVSELCTVVFA